MRWDTERRESFEYARVRMPRGDGADAWNEVGSYGMFDGGSIELSASSALRSSGTLSFSGAEVPDTSDLVRVRYLVDDMHGGSQAFVLGTFLMSVSDPKWDMGLAVGEASLLSVLHIAQSKRFGIPYVIGRGCNCVERARQFVEGLGLRVCASQGQRLLRRDIVMAPGDSYLDAANRLLAAAGFDPCDVDAYGGVVMRPHGDAGAASWTFREGESSIMRHEVSMAYTGQSVPNAVCLRWTDGGVGLWARAVDDDPDSPSSVRNLGYEITLCDEAADPGGGGREAVAAEIVAQAARRLRAEQSATERCTVVHPWVPIGLGERVSVEYPSSGLEFSGSVEEVSMSWDESQNIKCETTAARMVEPFSRVRTSWGALWE